MKSYSATPGLRTTLSILALLAEGLPRHSQAGSPLPSAETASDTNLESRAGRIAVIAVWGWGISTFTHDPRGRVAGTTRTWYEEFP